MTGNISKTTRQGSKGDKGDIPAITLLYDEETGNLYYSSDSIMIGKEYTDSKNFVTKKYLSEMLVDFANKVAQTPAIITLYADRWIYDETSDRWYQKVVVANANVTEYSKIDLQLSVEQIEVFHNKSITIHAENYGGKEDVVVFSVGGVPESDYVIQATVSEVVVNVEE